MSTAPFPYLIITPPVSNAERLRKSQGQSSFFPIVLYIPRSSGLSRPRWVIYRELMKGS